VGGARAILKLGEAGLVLFSASPQVLSELENSLRRKAPELLGKMVVLLDRIGLAVTATAPEIRYQEALALTGHAGDGRVLADAWEAGTDFFVTLDRQHFLENRALRQWVPFQMGTPGDFLIWYRKNDIEIIP
jgi:predicted nucleic acid-binding protein